MYGVYRPGRDHQQGQAVHARSPGNTASNYKKDRLGGIPPPGGQAIDRTHI